MSELNPIQHGPRPPAALASAHAPGLEDVLALAEEMTVGLLPAGPNAHASPSPPGLGGKVDIYDTIGVQAMGALSGGRGAETMALLMNGDFAQGLSTAEPIVPPPDFPYLKPLGHSLGRVFNALI